MQNSKDLGDWVFSNFQNQIVNISYKDPASFLQADETI